MTRLPWETSRRDLSTAIRSALKSAGFKNYKVRSGRPNGTDCMVVYVYHWMHERGGRDHEARTEAYQKVKDLVEPILPEHLDLNINIRGSR